MLLPKVSVKQKGRPAGGGPSKTTMRGVSTPPSVEHDTDAARRRNAAWRTPPLPCGHRDPLDCLPTRDGPSTYGLSHRELYLEVQHRIRDGWQGWEIAARFKGVV